MEHKLSIMGPTGHQVAKWNPDTGEGVAEAGKLFDESQKNRMVMMAKDQNTGEFEKVTTFDKNNREQIAMPALAGG